ncbi:hypothetical protein DSO57_1036138 [Entomophthora muscae]|uniref:Uncharacterized protein n=1 Tax=Entomophthora muscae TaxID=34485 RepID=A0ACC2TY31_9FUNG|nr:hypothetical protein DSO57_1036138 [Entomophthora muscae]
MWSKPIKISQPLPCYTGEKCKISVDWTFTGHSVNYTKKSHKEQSPHKPSRLYSRVTHATNLVTFSFIFFGPAEFHLEFQREYWALPLKRKWYNIFEEQRYLKYPVHYDGIPVGLIMYKKGPKFEQEY